MSSALALAVAAVAAQKSTPARRVPEAVAVARAALAKVILMRLILAQL
jgi:hypothetical protein